MHIDLFTALGWIIGGGFSWLAIAFENHSVKSIGPVKISKSISTLITAVLTGFIAIALALYAVALVHGTGYSDGFWCATNFAMSLFFLCSAITNSTKYLEAMSEQIHQQLTAFNEP